MGGADNRVAANTDSGGEPNVGELEHHLVGEGTRLRDKTDLALTGDIRRSNANQALLRGDNTGAVRPDNAGNLLAVLVHRSLRGSPELSGILHRHALGNDDDQTDLSLNSLKHGGFGEGGRHENNRNVRTGF